MPENKTNNDLTEEEGLLPPQALPTPPPPPPATQDSSTLLSPWWSEEPPAADATATADSAATEIEPTKEQVEPTLAHKEPKDSALNLSIMTFGRSSPPKSEAPWKERCFLFATTKGEVLQSGSKKRARKELEEMFDKSRECKMICFLRHSRQLTKDRLLKENKDVPMTFSINPFYGTWITVAKTPKRCKDHLMDANIQEKKTFADYYTMELGEELSHSGEYVTNAVKNTFNPLQHLTTKYIESWKNGNQQSFFYKFWSSVQKGDAIYLVRDSTKRLIENALGHDKKK